MHYLSACVLPFAWPRCAWDGFPQVGINVDNKPFRVYIYIFVHVFVHVSLLCILFLILGYTDYHQRLHAFIVSGDGNRTSLTYTNTGLFEPIVATFDDSLQSPSLCGADYECCNVLVTSNADRLIRVVLLPLELGIGIVSFSCSDSLVFCEKFLLPQNEPNCTYVHFVNEVIGYCLEVDPPRIRAFRIYTLIS